MSRLRLHDRSTFTAYSRSEVDCVRQTVETWYVTVSIIDQVMTDERRGLQTVIRDSSQRHVEMYGGIQRGVLLGREETHLGEHAGATSLQ